jgi:abortive infection bacteriophage resistance protein
MGRSSAFCYKDITLSDEKPAHTKPYTGKDQQLALMQTRGLSIPRPDRAMDWLERVGYYRLSAYAYPFRVLEETHGKIFRADQYRDGATFQNVTDFYLFDKQIRLLLSDPIERIEIAVRNAIVDTLGAYGPFDHRNPVSYKDVFTRCDDAGEIPLECFMAGLDREFGRSKAEFAKHFRRRYSGFPPIWIAAEEWTWGNMTFMLQNLNTRNREAVASRFRLEQGTLVSWMSSLNELRNRCAHHSRNWNRPFTNNPQLTPRKVPYFEALVPDGGPVSPQIRTRLYGCTAVIIYLLRHIHEETEWPNRFRKTLLEADLPEEIGLHTAGFIEGWETHSIWWGD